MTSVAAPSPYASAPLQSYNQRRLFIASCLALVATAMAFAIRGDIMEALGQHFSINKTQLGVVGSLAFLGFAISIFLGGPLCDTLGMGKLMVGAFLFHTAGVLLTIFAPNYHILYLSSLVIGLGNGLVEAVINPLIATIFNEQKTHKLNVLHAWWPGGQIIAGVLAFAMTKANIGWQFKMATILIVIAIYGVLLLGQRFPATERVASGISSGEMFKEAFRPFFLLWMFCMLLTAATELAPMQWLPNVLTRTAQIQGILVLVYINVLMFVMRSAAGAVVHRLSPIGLLWFSSVLGALGLFALSHAQTAIAAFGAATIFAVGICYFWPTMLGVTSERCPKGGALLMGLMGTAGNISIFFVLPLMGNIYDQYTVSSIRSDLAPRIKTADGHMNQDELNKLLDKTANADDRAAAESALATGAAMAFRWIALVPCVLILIFGAIWLKDKASGGYQAVRLDVMEAEVSHRPGSVGSKEADEVLSHHH